MGYNYKEGHKKMGGRKKGTKNKYSGNVKKMFDIVVKRLGGEHALLEYAEDNPKEFWNFISKMLPRDIAVSGGLELNGSLNIGDYRKSHAKYNTKKKR